MHTDRTTWARDTVILLGTLAPRVAAVVSLTYFERCDEAEICARTGWSTDTVREANAEGLRELGRLLQQLAPDRTTAATIA